MEQVNIEETLREEENENKNKRTSYDITKRGIDFLLSLLGLVILSPILLIVALIIKLDSRGPVIFKQERVWA